MIPNRHLLKAYQNADLFLSVTLTGSPVCTNFKGQKKGGGEERKKEQWRPVSHFHIKERRKSVDTRQMGPIQNTRRLKEL
ncbi:hypothetical protein KFK09_018737 [Dendrobium nobile]|uniref:Uncharacterized protein n=1 Tax=Dendrobium nobile TaxID=94219 RepID=A0A8T3AVM2_DENNO|nr:hypothetical protein KFK09_018737 [Dendrobium nobile]